MLNALKPLGLPGSVIAAWLGMAGATLLPGALFYAHRASSHAAGASLAALLALVLAAASARQRGMSMTREWLNWSTVAAATLALVSLHAVIASLWLEPVVGKPLHSLVPLALLIMGGGALAALLSDMDRATLDRTLHVILLALMIAWLFGTMRWQPLYALYAFHKPMFPYTEPSHLALGIVPFALYVCVQSRGWRQFGWLAAITVMMLATKNVTLAVVCVLVLAVTASWKVLVPIAGAAAIVLSQLDLYYYVERINVEKTLNTSTLVFFQGWELMALEWRQSSGWGIGFQQLGLHGHMTPSSWLMVSVEGAPRNTLDGGFVLAKLISEFGAAGLAVSLLYVALAARFAWRLRHRQAEHSMQCPLFIFAQCVFVGFSVEFFVRGGGYFSSGTLMLAMASWLLWKSPTRKKP